MFSIGESHGNVRTPLGVYLSVFLGQPTKGPLPPNFATVLPIGGVCHLETRRQAHDCVLVLCEGLPEAGMPQAQDLQSSAGGRRGEVTGVTGEEELVHGLVDVDP